MYNSAERRIMSTIDLIEQRMEREEEKEDWRKKLKNNVHRVEKSTALKGKR